MGVSRDKAKRVPQPYEKSCYLRFSAFSHYALLQSVQKSLKRPGADSV